MIQSVSKCAQIKHLKYCRKFYDINQRAELSMNIACLLLNQMARQDDSNKTKVAQSEDIKVLNCCINHL